MVTPMQVIEVLRLLCIALCCAALSPVGAGAQDASRTVYAAPNPLFQFAPGDAVICSPLPLADWHRAQGIAKQYLIQLPGTRRSGQLGIGPTGRVRYLIVSLEQPQVNAVELYAASLQFAPDGAMEVGRQSWELSQGPDGQPQRNVTALRPDEGAAALAFARYLAGRCPP